MAEELVTQPFVYVREYRPAFPIGLTEGSSMQVPGFLSVLGEDSSPAGVARTPGEVQPHRTQVLTALSTFSRCPSDACPLLDSEAMSYFILSS